MIDSINNIGNLSYNSGSMGSCAGGTPQVDAQLGNGPQDLVTLSAEAQGQSKSQKDLEPDEKQQVNQLKSNAEVKAHEQAHMAAGGGLVQGGASYPYQRGPDGKMFAIGGEVKIDTSPERTPEGTIRKMRQVKRAALAPAQPSSTDRSVAARAAQVESQARAQLSKAAGPAQMNGEADAPARAEVGLPVKRRQWSYSNASNPAAEAAMPTGRTINLNI